MNEEDIALIDRFLMGELEGEELAAFNRRVAEDEQFREELEFLRSIGKVSKRMEMRSHLNGVEEQILREGGNEAAAARSYKPLFTVLVAACIVGVIATVYIINSDPDPIRYGDPLQIDNDTIPPGDSAAQDTSQLGKFKQLIDGLDMGGGEE